MKKREREKNIGYLIDYSIDENYLEQENSKRSKYEIISELQEDIASLEVMMRNPNYTVKQKLQMHDDILTFTMDLVEQENSEDNIQNFKNRLEEYNTYYYSIMEDNNDLALSYLGRLEDLQSYAEALEIKKSIAEKKCEVPMLPSVESILSYINSEVVLSTTPTTIINAPLIEEVKTPQQPLLAEDAHSARARSVVYKSVQLFQQQINGSASSKIYEKARERLDHEILEVPKALLSKAVEEKLDDINYSLECLPSMRCSNPEAKIEEYKIERAAYLKREKEFLGKLALQFERIHDTSEGVKFLGANNFADDM
jgi:hypothetical protein